MRIYVAGPYSKGDVFANIRRAVQAGTALIKRGHSPFVPHLTGFWDFLTPLDYEEWLAYDMEWVRVCDAILRLPGESSGADREVAFAKELGKPVYFAVEMIPPRDP